jgi:hypothetical protein
MLVPGLLSPYLCTRMIVPLGRVKGFPGPRSLPRALHPRSPTGGLWVLGWSFRGGGRRREPGTPLAPCRLNVVLADGVLVGAGFSPGAGLAWPGAGPQGLPRDRRRGSWPGWRIIIRIKEKKTHRMGSKAAEAQIGLTAGFEAVGPVMSQSGCIYWSDRHYL